MQDLKAEREFYAELFGRNPQNEHIVGGYDEIHAMALPHVPDGYVLDLGCGTGAHAAHLAGRGAKVIAVDLTREGVRATRDRLSGCGLGGFFVVADAEHLPFRDHAIAVGWTALLLHHFPRMNAVAAELARVVTTRITAFEPNAQNGLTWLANNIVNRWWGLSTMTPNQRALTPGAVRKAFQSHGFRQLELHYVDRKWGDGFGWVRRTYDAIAAWLPPRFRANKFLIVVERPGT